MTIVINAITMPFSPWTSEYELQKLVKRHQFALRMRQKKTIYITFTAVIKHVLYMLRGLVASEKESNGLRFLSLARNDLRCVMTCGITRLSSYYVTPASTSLRVRG